ncbi:MAG TPA: prepilin-type N-terminal cleavage/methylation domain-containing protein [Candidatus Saccharimonadales bacterium]|nr:prepilin-type N-terminal cleavage/methylation domain-containing protein [Candidatus Saccharimonadales bacterium]
MIDQGKIKNKGFTLIEVLVYVTILGITSLVIILFINQLFGVMETSRRIREATDNARRSIDTIAQEIRHAKTVYTPTSVFGGTAGQLSLETARDLPTDHDTTFVDFYLDNGQLFLKREGQAAQRITGEKIKVTALTFQNYNGTTSWPAIQTTITLQYRDPINGPKNSVTLTTSTVLRALQL